MSRERNLKVAPSYISHGVGLFPIDKIKKDDIIFNFNWSDYELFNIEDFSKKKKDYLYQIWGHYNIPISPYFHPVNFLNHSYNPNIKFDDITKNYIAIKDISPTEELSINYKNYHDPLLSKIKVKRLTKKNKNKYKKTMKKLLIGREPHIPR